MCIHKYIRGGVESSNEVVLKDYGGGADSHYRRRRGARAAQPRGHGSAEDCPCSVEMGWSAVRGSLVNQYEAGGIWKADLCHASKMLWKVEINVSSCLRVQSLDKFELNITDLLNKLECVF